MLWLYLLAAITLLVINRRRILRRITPLNDELYSSRVAVEHVHSGVAWVLAEGKIGSVNQSLADSLGTQSGELPGTDWYQMFARAERPRVNDAYAQMLLAGIASLDTAIERADGTARPVNLRLVAVHDHKSRLLGFHCMVHDESRTRSLQQQVQDLSEALSQAGYELVPTDEVEHPTATGV